MSKNPYEDMLLGVIRKLPPIIYHYNGKNTLGTDGQRFYYTNPYGVVKFETDITILCLLDLIKYLKHNKFISWNK